MPHQRLFRGLPWLDVVEERARILSRNRTGSDAFWELYMFEISTAMYDEVTYQPNQTQDQANYR
ncbi:MAG: hypothetical protein ACTSX7_13950 [Alphaproteobacteria bacterium]